MKLRAKFGVIVVALTFVLGLAYIAHAGSGTDQQVGQSTDKAVSSNSRNVNSRGAVRVDRDFGERHKWDTNQFGDDRAYTSARSGTSRDADKWVNKWHPETYGLQGDYGYYSGGPN